MVCGRCGYIYQKKALAPGQTQIFRVRPRVIPTPVSFPHGPWSTQLSLLAVAGLFLTLCGLLIGLSMRQPHRPARTMLCSHHLPGAVRLPMSMFAPVGPSSPVQDTAR